MIVDCFMENKNSLSRKFGKKFLEKYFAEENRVKQLSMLKEYMLSLSLDELLAFNKEQCDKMEKILRSPDVSDERKQKIFDNLDEMIFLLKGKIAA
ncbi:MAG TPA: hypothetical protein ENJ95_15525 [Bacteroidetes bacterium]|nr:hypothetical protein [Bacteroidota bacterium]